MKKIKLWVTDIDGTIMNYDGSYTPEMFSFIQEIQKKGVKFVLATGRMFMGADFVAKKFNLDTPIICYQGAMVRHGDKVLWRSDVQKKLACEIIEYLRAKKIHTNVYDDNVLYVENDDKEIMDAYCNNRGTTYVVLDDFMKLPLDNVSKLLGVINDEKLMQEVKLELQKKYEGVLTIVQSSKCYLEITDIGASKGFALEFLKKYWNLSDDEVLASGDQDNDIELLKEAGIRVCVGNNSKELGKIAQYRAKDVNSNELIEIIKRYLWGLELAMISTNWRKIAL